MPYTFYNALYGTVAGITVSSLTYIFRSKAVKRVEKVRSDPTFTSTTIMNYLGQRKDYNQSEAAKVAILICWSKPVSECGQFCLIV